uniref:Zinc-binding protein A33-like n=1 Tax=Hucho hucho TaxID=62062 RepID=A0A4W5MGJ2_9TELE
MEASLSLLEEHLSCPVCCDIFNNPVVLKCSHSFCEECLQKCCKDMEIFLCPVCRKECSTGDPSQSLALKSLCESFQRGSEKEKGSQDTCQLHGETLKLFCLNDKQPICVVCHTSKKHKGHDCCPIEEALPDLKSEIKAPLQNKLKKMTAAKLDNENWAEHLMVQGQLGEEQIRGVFKKFYQFLEEEEAARIAALKKEQQLKYEVMRERVEKLTENISMLSETIGVIKKDMETDDITFLQNYKAILIRANCTPPETAANAEMGPGAFIDMAKHVGCLTFKVWDSLIKIVDYNPVTMDPNTVSTKLILTDDLTTVTCCEEKQSLPDNPERFHVGVLGSEGFNKGKHFWDVEVGDSDNWSLGIAKESIVRKKPVKLDPQSGLWSIRYINGKYKAGVKSSTEIKVDERPQVIRVCLDCDKGVVTFCDPVKSTTLYTFKDRFTEKLFPYFSTGSIKSPLRLCKRPLTKVTVN